MVQSNGRPLCRHSRLMATQMHVRKMQESRHWTIIAGVRLSEYFPLNDADGGEFLDTVSYLSGLIECPLRVTRRRKAAPISMSAFGGKADVNHCVGECPLIAISGHWITTDILIYLESSPQVPTNRYLPKVLARTCRLKGCPLSERTDPVGEMGCLTLPLNFRKPKIDILERDGDGQVR